MLEHYTGQVSFILLTNLAVYIVVTQVQYGWFKHDNAIEGC